MNITLAAKKAVHCKKKSIEHASFSFNNNQKRLVILQH
jgi:hypothetical protein